MLNLSWGCYAFVALAVAGHTEVHLKLFCTKGSKVDHVSF